jgi:DUF1365 family protein
VTDGALYHGRVYHRRLKPVGHAFAYRVFSLLVDVDEIADVAARLRWFSYNRTNLFSLHAIDHGAQGGETIGDHARAMLKDAGYSGAGRITLLCYPRILGFVFNPLSVYWCRDGDDALEAVIYEVRNTFGGRHCYVIPAAGDGAPVRQSADKVFHVSPFMDMEMRYNFELSAPGDRVRIVIREEDREGPILIASFDGAREALSDRALMRAFFRYPLMTVKIIAAIHFEAMRLLAKGLRLKRGAPDPANEATHVAQSIAKGA